MNIAKPLENHIQWLRQFTIDEFHLVFSNGEKVMVIWNERAARFVTFQVIIKDLGRWKFEGVMSLNVELFLER
jgi:hypothetical protein